MPSYESALVFIRFRVVIIITCLVVYYSWEVVIPPNLRDLFFNLRGF